METLLVTEWQHPSFDMTLILQGSAQETREEARQYCDAERANELTHTEKQMDKKDFEALPEFDG